MAEEHPPRAVHGGETARHRAPETRRHAPAATGETRAAARRLARARRRRRYAVEAIAATAVASLLALVGYAQWWSEPSGEEPAEREGLPAGVGRPSLPSSQPTAPAVPGLRPRERPPSPSPSPSVRPGTPTPPTVPLILTVGRSDVPATVNLTDAGERDWVHWGLGGGAATVRKRDGSAEIRDLGGQGERGGWDGNQELFRWRDGEPVRSAGGTPDGVYTCGVDNGFSLAVVADGQPRTATVYLGVWMARGRLDMRLSDGGPSRTLRLEERHTSQSTRATIRFQAPKGTRLLLTWTVEETFTSHCGNVGLQAVALR
ncbi:hypothetical protein SAMN05443287_110122 [Micromonospora phaseoli]|uniref:Uncharacterized protein n=1 Tax=Micromonospora phaseoli TaxID=1144548 RepID=A0A1H7CYK8_9ACTN|nr:hypothetical protein [Micromonospora phaseoli]PZV91569.1 hypothetical protein CLV64_11188 [Micromonospora phaseoli]GIJ80771.1 hypothetical protein Xph01_52030 [Micromonospora phaseoli]SEJ92322.1 hypothetical protein SAMN05443287_110122 [Micromonospora phaseoli]